MAPFSYPRGRIGTVNSPQCQEPLTWRLWDVTASALKWNVDGELSSVDQQRILERLSHGDPLGVDLLCCPVGDAPPVAP